jgi:uncharacterized protein YjbJ (UPF0337 family)
MGDEHKGEEMKGRIKEGIGDVTDNDSLKREGKVDQGSAKTKRKVSEGSEKIKDAVNPRR